MRTRIKVLSAVLTLLIIIILLSSGYVIARFQYENGYNKSQDEIGFSEGVFYKQFIGFGPGTVKLEAVKVLRDRDDDMDNIMAWMEDANGKIIGGASGEFKEKMGKRIDGICDYYVIVNCWNIKNNGNYVLYIRGLRKDSRDHLKISTLRVYTLDKSDFQKKDGSYYYTFQQDSQANLHLSAWKSYRRTDGCDNIRVSLKNKMGTEIFSCCGYFKGGVSEKEQIEESLEGYPWGDMRDIAGAMLSLLLLFASDVPEDQYCVDRVLTLAGNGTQTLEISKEESGSVISIFATYTGSPSTQMVWEVEERRYFNDVLIVFLNQPEVISAILFPIAIFVLIGLVKLYRRVNYGKVEKVKKTSPSRGKVPDNEWCIKR